MTDIITPAILKICLLIVLRKRIEITTPSPRWDHTFGTMVQSRVVAGGGAATAGMMADASARQPFTR